MIKVGKKTKAKYWGNFTVEKVVGLDNPIKWRFRTKPATNSAPNRPLIPFEIKCLSAEKGEVDFNPTIVKILWDQFPSEDKHDLWFPYWITIDRKEKYGQFAPMMGQKAFFELMTKAIDADYFDKEFLIALNKKISDYLP